MSRLSKVVSSSSFFRCCNSWRVKQCSGFMLGFFSAFRFAQRQRVCDLSSSDLLKVKEFLAVGITCHLLSNLRITTYWVGIKPCSCILSYHFFADLEGKEDSVLVSTEKQFAKRPAFCKKEKHHIPWELPDEYESHLPSKLVLVNRLASCRICLSS